MYKPISPDDGEPRLNTRPLEEVLPLVQANDERVRAALGAPTKAEVEDSDPRIPAFMCDPFLTADHFLEKTSHAQAIIVVAFATGTIPDRLVPALVQRMHEGIPVFVLSNNPGENHGILQVKYDAGRAAYLAGAVPLQKINVNDHRTLKAALRDALDGGLAGQDLARTIRERYAYQEGEPLPVPEWQRPGYVPSPPKSARDMLRDGGFIDDDGVYTPPVE